MDSNFSALQSNVAALFEAIELHGERKHPLPLLMLLYSGMDVIASLEKLPGERTQSTFTRWTDSYLLRTHDLACSSLELYAARCGILHSFSADSDLYRAGRARRVVYAWGTSSKADLLEAAKLLGHTDLVAVHVTDLVNAFRRAVGEYFLEVSEDDQRVQPVLTNAGMWLVNMDQALMRAFLDRTSSGADA